MTVWKGTPGPWAVGGTYEDGSEDARVVTSDDGTKYHRRILLARMLTPTGLGDDHPVVEANARLIAAAPELYAALCEVWADHKRADPHSPERCSICTIAIAAITKATEQSTKGEVP